MRPVVDYLTEHGAVAHLETLRMAGYSSEQIENAAAAGRLVRVRRGIYASPWAAREVVRAARVGGRLAGVSSARAHGLWVPQRNDLVVEVGRSANRLRDPDDAMKDLGKRKDVRVIWAESSRALSGSVGLSPLLETLRQCILTEPVPIAVAIIDSCLRRHSVDRIELVELERSLPPRYSIVFSLLDGRSDSGTESILRVLLDVAGVSARPQQTIPGSDLERMDLLVGDRLVIECDSEAFHGAPEHRVRDLRRDAQLAALGFIVLRFDYAQVMFEQASVLAAVLSYVDRGLHWDA